MNLFKFNSAVETKDYESDSGQSATNEHVLEIIGDEDDMNVDIGRCLSEDALDGAENQENSHENVCLIIARLILIVRMLVLIIILPRCYRRY